MAAVTVLQNPFVTPYSKLELLVKQFAAHGVTPRFFADDREALRWLERQE